MPEYTIAVLEDSIQVLDAFLNGKDHLTLSQLTHDTGLSKNKAFRILATLEKHRLVERDDVGSYRLGIRLLDYSQKVQKNMAIIEASRTVMDWLVAETRESVILGIRDRHEALCIDMRESPQSIRLYAHVGRRAPLYVGGVPKVLLAFLPDKERETLLAKMDLKPITPHTITDRQVLASLLQEVRNQGYIVSADDLEVGAHSIAAPVQDYRGRALAAISVAGPSNRFTEENIKRYIKFIREGAARISRALGYRDCCKNAISPCETDPPPA